MQRFGFLAVTVLIAATSAAAAESLPLKPGYYVQRETPCDKASNATITLYDGVSFGAAHVECRNPLVHKLADGSYRSTRRCKDMQGRGGSWEIFKSDYRIQSQTEFVERSSFGTFSFRYCSKSNLPDPWKTNDQSRYGIE